MKFRCAAVVNRISGLTVYGCAAALCEFSRAQEVRGGIFALTWKRGVRGALYLYSTAREQGKLMKNPEKSIKSDKKTV